MSMTERQKKALVERVARAIAWHQAQVYQRNEAKQLAERLVEDLDSSGSSDRAVRRALEVVTERLEDAG